MIRHPRRCLRGAGFLPRCCPYQEACGSRSGQCPTCGQTVVLSRMDAHQVSGCKDHVTTTRSRSRAASDASDDEFGRGGAPYLGLPSAGGAYHVPNFNAHLGLPFGQLRAGTGTFDDALMSTLSMLGRRPVGGTSIGACRRSHTQAHVHAYIHTYIHTYTRTACVFTRL